MNALQESPPNGIIPQVFRKVAECLYRNESSGIYYALVKRHGKQIRRSLKTTDRQLAARRLTEFRDKVGRLSHSKSVNKITFEELAARWFETARVGLKPSSARRRLTSINQLKPVFGRLPVRNITTGDCDGWLATRGGSVAASTYNNEKETLRQILDYAKRDGLILDNPAENLPRRKLDKAQIVIPTQQQFTKLVQKLREMDRRYQPAADLVELLAYSGMRLAEAVGLRWGDVDFERGCFVVTGGQAGTKNHEARTVPLFPAMKRLLEHLRGSVTARPHEPVIPIDTAKKALASACQRADLPHFTHHTMRHYFVSNAIEAGIDFKVIAGWVGHKDGGVLVAKTYGHLRDAHSFEMAKRMTFEATRPHHTGGIAKT